ncbi:hypothetical protein LshimejAT787_0904330 [Lyophyllum shimeji]|uniref:Uncharacterized protein n=1 Tax=Lyophyllum shimeji TaxID=47721 RepID=A0A9P3PSG0_LYOSH|nr:hypothetical protein LshimejAT787_0904330 [Lyophyllum shimeji]
MDTEQPGKLLAYRQARGAWPPAFVYGFPIDESGLRRCGEKLRPIPPDLAGDELRKARAARCPLVIRHLRALASRLWPPHRVDVERGFTNGKHYTLVALAACTRPNDEFIPHGEEMRRLKEAMANEGLEEEPRWFLLTSSP